MTRCRESKSVVGYRADVWYNIDVPVSSCVQQVRRARMISVNLKAMSAATTTLLHRAIVNR